MPNVKPGNAPEKAALSLLLELTDNFSLEQIVNRSIRKENISDLVLKNDAEAFPDYRSIIMAPISDHKMVTFNITDTSGEHKEF